MRSFQAIVVGCSAPIIRITSWEPHRDCMEIGFNGQNVVSRHQIICRGLAGLLVRFNDAQGAQGRGGQLESMTDHVLRSRIGELSSHNQSCRRIQSAQSKFIWSCSCYLLGGSLAIHEIVIGRGARYARPYGTLPCASARAFSSSGLITQSTALTAARSVFSVSHTSHVIDLIYMSVSSPTSWFDEL